MPTDPTRSLAPLDRHNLTLLENVRPAQHATRPSRDEYHAIVLGAGAAGLVSASIVAGLGGKVLLVERALLGGDCLNVGCVPSKALIRSARAAAAVRAAPGFGIGPQEALVDGAAVLERLRERRARISPADSLAGLEGKGVEVVFGQARFTGADRVEVNGHTARFRRAFIATGGRPAIPPIPGLDSVRFFTNENLFNRESLPGHLLVAGGGPIGCELAQSLALLGCRVTLVEQAERLLIRDDPEGALAVQQALEAAGVDVRLATRLVRLEGRGECGQAWLEHTAGGEELGFDALLLATGRQPNTEELDLEHAGILTGSRGQVLVNDFLRTANRRVLALGDVIGGPQFTHAADAMARAAVRNAFFFGRARRNQLLIPWCTYTTPELAGVGPDLTTALAAGERAAELVVHFRDLDRAVLDSEENGFLKVVHDARGRLLGARILGPHAGELLAPVIACISGGVRLGQLSGMVFPYPTVGEALRKLGDQYQRTRLSPGLAGLLGRVLRSRR
ncbi:MAG: FAD-dependent oxidoreductase [Candidatus Delongbacteria bacterium]|nr:FAD-dependent oxidoreductase [Candidatus Delongbacteria bacterium]